MNVLVVTKLTNWEQFGEAAARQKDVARFHHLEKDFEVLKGAHVEHYEALELVENVLKKHRVSFTLIRRSDNWPIGVPFDAVITVGGDGTLLTASHNLLSPETPIIGIRSSKSSVGYLCCENADRFEAVLMKMLSGALECTVTSRIRASIDFIESGLTKTTLPALNDFLFANSNPAAVTRYQIALGGKKEIQKSSGIWVATATGSSAAIHAAGGTVQDRTDKMCQYFVRELYKMDTNTFKLVKGFFDPGTESLVVENHNSKALLALDGQRLIIPLKFGDRIRFEKAPALKICFKV
ncbi:MAG: NAD(+)/NADH kinase [Oligoflexales bacterium]